jgi:xanthine/CO dehydrogenase XdhC/CoxF family maturation factor
LVAFYGQTKRHWDFTGGGCPRGPVIHRASAAREKQNHHRHVVTCGHAIQTQPDLTEAEVKRMRMRFRSLSPDHRERGALLRQLEIAAAVAGEPESLLATMIEMVRSS